MSGATGEQVSAKVQESGPKNEALAAPWTRLSAGVGLAKGSRWAGGRASGRVGRRVCWPEECSRQRGAREGGSE